jgi:hypothetical protein
MNNRGRFAAPVRGALGLAERAPILAGIERQMPVLI